MHSKQELEYLSELMDDFPVTNHLTAEDAYDIIITRYRELESNLQPMIQRLAKLLEDESVQIVIRALPEPANANSLVEYWMYLCKMLHGYLFDGILSNAALFRQSSEPNNGRVGFGGMSSRAANSSKFYGTPPPQIEEELHIAFAYLKKTGDPVRNALEFYRRFVRIHPFYDANGRIARVIVTIYLTMNNKYVMWSGIETKENKNNFIKRLNNCHLRQESPAIYEKYFNFLYDFFIKFVEDTAYLNRAD